MSDKRFPTDPRGNLDVAAGADVNRRACCRRINHENVSRFETSVTWCTLDEGHEGQCSGPLPSIVELDDLGPLASKRRRW